MKIEWKITRNFQKDPSRYHTAGDPGKLLQGVSCYLSSLKYVFQGYAKFMIWRGMPATISSLENKSTAAIDGISTEVLEKYGKIKVLACKTYHASVDNMYNEIQTK